MPFAHDQPDHADRVFRLGVGRTVPRLRYQARRVAKELKKLLYDPKYAIRAAEIGRQVRAEDGIAAACDRIEQVLADTANAPRLPSGGNVAELLGDAMTPHSDKPRSGNGAGAKIGAPRTRPDSPPDRQLIGVSEAVRRHLGIFEAPRRFARRPQQINAPPVAKPAFGRPYLPW